VGILQEGKVSSIPLKVTTLDRLFFQEALEVSKYPGDMLSPDKKKG
jgi:hypothetical protein